MKCHIMEKKASSFTFRAHSTRSKQLAGEGLRGRTATGCLKINIICFVRIRAGDIERQDRRFAAISHEEVPGRRAEQRGKRVRRRKDRSPRRFSGSIARDMQSSRETCRRPSFHRPLRLRLPFSFPPSQKFLLALSTFRYCVGGQAGALLATIFARRKPLFQPRLSWIAAPAGVNEWRRTSVSGGAARARGTATRNAPGNVLPHGGDSTPAAKSRCRPR